MRLLACLIVAPQRGYDEPAILSYAISSFCPTSADGLQQQEASGPLRAQARRRRRAKARRKPHATKRPVIGTASPRLNRSADNASDTADNASNTAAATATLKARFIPGSSKRSHGLRGCKGD